MEPAERKSVIRNTLPFLKSYSGQTIQQVIALKGSYRLDSLVGVVEQALCDVSLIELTKSERVVVAVEALEREVNNGGYDQFFINSSSEFAPFVVQALEIIGCPKVAAISAKALAELHLPEPIDGNTVTKITLHLAPDGIARLSELDEEYFANDESIENCLFKFIEQHADEIHIPRQHNTAPRWTQ